MRTARGKRKQALSSYHPWRQVNLVAVTVATRAGARACGTPRSNQLNQLFLQSRVEYRQRALIVRRLRFEVWSQQLTTSVTLGKSFDLYGA